MQFLVKFIYFIAPLILSTLVAYYTKKFLDRRQKLIVYYGHTAIGKIINRGVDINIATHSTAGLSDEKPLNQGFYIFYVTDSVDRNKQWYLIGKNTAQEEVRGYINDLSKKYSTLTWVVDFLSEKTYSNISENDRLFLKDKILSSFGMSLDIIKTTIFTHSLIINNSSDQMIHNIRIRHLVLLPINIADCISIYPPDEYQVKKMDSYQEIVFSSLAPKTELVITYTYLPPLTRDSFNINVRSDEGCAKFVSVILNKQYPRLVYAVATIFLIMGLATTIYLVIRFFNLLICVSNICT